MTKSRWFRRLLPTMIIVGWLTLAGIGGSYFGKISDISSTDLDTFLPSNAESSLVNEELRKFNDSEKAIPVIIAYEKSKGKLTPSDMAQLSSVNETLSDINGVAGDISTVIPSEDLQAAITVVPLESDGDFTSTFTELKRQLSDAELPVTYKFTGPAMLSYDIQNALSTIDGTLLLVAVSVVLLILIIVYRSPLLPFLVLGSAMVALTVAVLTVYYLAQADVIQMNGQVQAILFILVIGAATDYSLLYIARYREELTNHKSSWDATVAAWKSSYESILAAAATVAVGLMCLLFSELGSNRALGPAGGIGIALSALTTLTLLPALLLAVGRAGFWPRAPHYVREKEEIHYKKIHPVWFKIGSFVRLHPRRIWLACMIGLLVACIGIPQLKADGVPRSDFIIGQSETREGQKILDAHFPSGMGSPVYVITQADKQDSMVAMLDDDEGVATVSIAVSGTEADAMPVGEAAATMARHAFMSPDIKTVDGNILLQATLTDPADSIIARDTAQRLRDQAKQIDDRALVGGQSASQLDTNDSSQRDMRVIMPLILVAITIILMLLLRAIIAPIVVLLTTVLSFGATMGVAALMFNHVWQFSGADPAIILLGFVFLIALGIDYNIFLMTRVREEVGKRGIHAGTIKGLVVTGGVITSAGIVLAATFASLNVIPILFLAQISFIVTFGVLLDTIIVRSLLLPALSLEIGRPMWWPSKLYRAKK